MAKQYVLTEIEMSDLRNRIERLKLERVEHIPQGAPERTWTHDLFRAFNYEVCDWLSTVTK